jgi:hypothetical protein
MTKLLPMLALAAATACVSVDLQRPEQWRPNRPELQADLYECLQGSQKVYFVDGQGGQYPDSKRVKLCMGAKGYQSWACSARSSKNSGAFRE